MRDPIPLFTALADRLEELKVPWIELREAQPADLVGRDPDRAGQPGDAAASIRARSCSTAIMTGPTRATRMAAGRCAMASASAGRSSPIPTSSSGSRLGAPLSAGDPSTFYSGGAAGYVDYPTLEEAKAA